MTDEHHAEQPEQWARELFETAREADNYMLAALTIQRAFAAREADLVGAETHRIGDRVKIIAPDWEHEPPHYITGIDWHPKHGVTYTTSEVWPPKVEGFHVCGLTDEWLPENIAALKSREASHG